MPMGIDIHAMTAPLFALWLPFVRILSFLHFCPVIRHKAFTRKAKIGTALLLAILITPMISQPVVSGELLSIENLLLAGEQILWGWLFGSMLHLVLAALEAAGQILSMNMGLGMAMMNDPTSGASTAVISQIIFTFSVLIFFTLNGHLLFVTILLKSFSSWPIGEASMIFHYVHWH
ncbi:flagellar biosynthesis protein FliR [Yersinia pestis 9]|nr:flagellar biosynthesis protein FliR [Yersinia pestis 9]